MLRLDSRGEDVRTLQENLTQLGYSVGAIDGIFGEKTEDAVILFQEAEGLYADGIVGPRTMAALEEALREHIIEQQSSGVDSVEQDPERLTFVRVPADKYKEGYNRFILRSDVAEAYQEVRREVTEAGGKLTSSGSRRSLTARVSPSRSATSFHYTGRALDLFVGSGMQDPDSDPYVVSKDKDGERYWRVYARADGGQHMEIEAITYSSRKQPSKVSGKFLDITQIFKNHNFSRIRARKSFFNNGTWLGAEWWHFQYEKGLIKGESTFGGELLRIYSKQTLRPTPPWQYRNRIFHVNWS